MDEPTLKTKIRVQAALRRCYGDGAAAAVLRKGDEDAGALALKINRLDGAFQVLTQARSLDGVLGWRRATGPAPVAEAEADDVIQREIGYDRDLWVIEIEDKEGRHFFGGEVFD